MSSSTPAPRFLLDENVRADLDAYLMGRGLDTKRLTKGAPDRSLRNASWQEKRVLVTNDEDFAAVPANRVFGVVLLRVPQRDAAALLAAFGTLLSECRQWAGTLVELEVGRWKATRLSPKRRTRRAA